MVTVIWITISVKIMSKLTLLKFDIIAIFYWVIGLIKPTFSKSCYLSDMIKSKLLSSK